MVGDAAWGKAETPAMTTASANALEVKVILASGSPCSAGVRMTVFSRSLSNDKTFRPCGEASARIPLRCLEVD